MRGEKKSSAFPRPRYARCETAAPALFRAIGGAAPQRISSTFSPDVLMATLRALVAVGSPAPDLLEAVAHAMGRSYGRFAPVDCSEVAARCAELGVPAPHLMHNIVRHSEDHFRDFTVGDLERFDSPILWQLVANGRARHGLGRPAPRDLLAHLEAFAARDVENPDFYVALCDRAAETCAAFAPADLAAFVAAAARARVASKPLFDAVAAHAVERIADFDPGDLVTLAWAYSTAGVVAPDLHAAINAAGPRKLVERAAAAAP